MQLNVREVRVEGGFEYDLPAMIPVKQSFPSPLINQDQIADIIAEQFKTKNITAYVRPGMKIAIGIGSRGIANLKEIVRHTISELKNLGAEPFIVPAMGSHGAGKAEGQEKILARYGITENQVGAPVKASMETVFLGHALGDIEVYFDRTAYEEADGIIVVSRIKPHTDFKGPIESGILKMLGIGLGKHKGASYLHRGGMANFDEVVPAVGQLIIDKTPFLFGVGIVENAFHETGHIDIVLKDELPQREEELLQNAKSLMPKLLFDEIDVLIVDEIGKNISGSGMDSNIIGRSSCNKTLTFDAPRIHKIVVLDLTEETNGNASGIGLADYTNQRTVEKINFSATYANAITAIEINGAKLPVILPNDKAAIVTALRTAGRRNLQDVKIVRIKNTLELNQILVSENMIDYVKSHPSLEAIGEAVGWSFDRQRNLK